MNPPIPPHNDEAEKGALGSMLISPEDCIPEISRSLKAEDFHSPAHQFIFTAIQTLWRDSQTLDFILLTKAIRAAGKLEAIGGAAYVTELFTFTPTAANAGHYAQIVRDCSNLRAIWRVCGQVAAAAAGPVADPTELIATLCALIDRLAADKTNAALTMRQYVSDALERYENAYMLKGSRPEGVFPTGISALDDELEGGLHPGDLVILAAETSGGKTALCIQICAHVAVKWESQVMVASYEMTARQLVDRMIAVASEIPSAKLRCGALAERDYQILTQAVGPLSAAGLHLRDAIGHWTVDDVASEARAIKARHGLSVLAVDYLQLTAPRTAPRGSQRNREREVAEISRALKGLAVELGITVLALSQLNEDGRLRESRAIGQDADVVLIIADAFDEDGKTPLEDRRTIRVEKNRHGARDRIVSLGWNGPLMRFDCSRRKGDADNAPDF